MPRILIQELDSTEKGQGSDMALYFGHSFVKLSQDGKTTPRWANYHGNHEEGHLFLFPGTEKSMLIPYKNQKAFVEWFFPTGWFNTKKSSVFCERIPRRQYSKGLANNTNIKVTSAENLAKECGILKGESPILAEILEDGKMKFNLDFIASVFEDVTYPDFEEAYLLLKSKKAFARALSNELVMIPHPYTKDFLILCHDLPVAELLTKNKIKMVIPDFKPECLAYFQPKGVSVVS